MAQFSACLKLQLNGEGSSFGFDSKDPLRRRPFIAYSVGGDGGYGNGSTSFWIRKNKTDTNGYTTRVYASSSSSSSRRKSKDISKEADHDACDDEILNGYDELETDELACFRGLVVDISYRPVNVVCWRRAICLEFMEKADVLEYYDQTVNSPSGSYYLPAVLRVPHLLQVVKRRRAKNSLSRRNILLRDNYSCQYCSSRENLTIDHVLPISRGGEWTWENLVAACAKCNSKKGRKTPEEANMTLVKVPKAPKEYDILAIPLTNEAIRMLRSRQGMPEEWHQYLAKPSSEH